MDQGIAMLRLYGVLRMILVPQAPCLRYQTVGSPHQVDVLLLQGPFVLPVSLH